MSASPALGHLSTNDAQRRFGDGTRRPCRGVSAFSRTPAHRRGRRARPRNVLVEAGLAARSPPAVPDAPDAARRRRRRTAGTPRPVRFQPGSHRRHLRRPHRRGAGRLSAKLRVRRERRTHARRRCRIRAHACDQRRAKSRHRRARPRRLRPTDQWFSADLRRRSRSQQDSPVTSKVSGSILGRTRCFTGRGRSLRQPP